MKCITTWILVCSACVLSTGCLSPDGGLQPMPWWPAGGDAWNKPAATAATKPPTTPPAGSFSKRQGMATQTNASVPQRPSGEAISVSVGDE